MADGLEPVGLAMVICDAIHIDPATGKRTLLGLFSAIVGRDFPAAVNGFCVYASITECRGVAPLVLQVVDANEERDPVMRIEGEVDCDDPLVMLDVEMRLPPMSFPEPGEYRVQLYIAGSPILERRIVLLSPPQAENDDE